MLAFMLPDVTVPNPLTLEWVQEKLLFDLPLRPDPRGNLNFVEGSKHVPFDIKRIFYIYDVPEGGSRGAHAHKELFQFLIPIAGSFQVSMDNGKSQVTIDLNNASQGLLIPPMIWAHEHNFTKGCVCLVLTNDYYKEHDYIREYSDFLEATK